MGTQRLESHQRKVLFQAPKPPGLNCETSLALEPWPPAYKQLSLRGGDRKEQVARGPRSRPGSDSEHRVAQAPHLLCLQLVGDLAGPVAGLHLVAGQLLQPGVQVVPDICELLVDEPGVL